MGSEEIDETPTGVASGGDRGRLGQRNHQLVDGASPGKGMCGAGCAFAPGADFRAKEY